jgi:hypothetical protein
MEMPHLVIYDLGNDKITPNGQLDNIGSSVDNTAYFPNQNSGLRNNWRKNV